MVVKKVLSSLVILMLSIGSASALEIPGKVFYSIKRTGDVVSRDMVLDLPARGEGDIVLRSASRNFSMTAKKSFTKRKRGQKTFYMVYIMKAPDSVGGQKSAMIFKGTYLRGKNLATYYGDMYSKKINDDQEVEELEGLEEKEDCLEGYEFKGGFSFEIEI